MKHENQNISTKASKIFAKILNRCHGRLWLKNYAATLAGHLSKIPIEGKLRDIKVTRISYGNIIENFFPSSANPVKCVIGRLDDIRRSLPEWDEKENDRIYDMEEKKWRKWMNFPKISRSGFPIAEIR